MGIKDTQYIIVRHHNTDNEHVHIIYNRIDNNLKLISVNHDYKRNIKVCKKLKDKHGLTYGEGKDRVKREKLRNLDKAKYYIHDALKSILPGCKNFADLRFGLKEFGIELEYKYKRTAFQVEVVSFRYDNTNFKGSEVDRKFSYGNLKKEIEKNLEEMKIPGHEEALREQEEQKARLEAEEKTRKETETKTSPAKNNFVIKGVELTDEQQETLLSGGYTFLENMKKSIGNGVFSSYVFLNEEKNRVFFSGKNPNEFVKYGKYEMRIRDKMLIEGRQITKATVKW